MRSKHAMCWPKAPTAPRFRARSRWPWRSTTYWCATARTARCCVRSRAFRCGLLVPGVQGVSSVKWLRRLEVGDQPWNTREESLHYIDMMPGGVHRQYSWIQEAKSVITSPSGGQVLVDRGYHQITGLAWSGRGKVARVDVSSDGGRNWRTARLQEPVLDKALTRFRIDWTWNGEPALLQSRVIDDTGFVQPTLGQLRHVRGTRSIYHNNAIQTWRVDPTGAVSNVQVE